MSLLFVGALALREHLFPTKYLVTATRLTLQWVSTVQVGKRLFYEFLVLHFFLFLKEMKVLGHFL